MTHPTRPTPPHKWHYIPDTEPSMNVPGNSIAASVARIEIQNADLTREVASLKFANASRRMEADRANKRSSELTAELTAAREKIKDLTVSATPAVAREPGDVLLVTEDDFKKVIHLGIYKFWEPSAFFTGPQLIRESSSGKIFCIQQGERDPAGRLVFREM